ncbi:MAG: hypothetical protein WBA65_10065 [Rhodanobacter sp.]|jgi:hypothetical protein
MNKWFVLGAILFGGLFVFFLVSPPASVASISVRGVLAFFVLGVYCSIVVFGTSSKKRAVSWPAQTVLGVVAALAVAALLGAPLVWYFAAVVFGVVLGATAHWWAGLVLDAA